MSKTKNKWDANDPINHRVRSGGPGASLNFQGTMRESDPVENALVAGVNGTLTEDSPLEGAVSGHNRHAKLMSPETRELVLHSRRTEIDKFAEDRGLNPTIVFGIAEAAMRMGKVPDLRQYGYAGDEAKAIKHFMAGEILNVAIEDEPAPGDKAVAETTSGNMGAMMKLGTGFFERPGVMVDSAALDRTIAERNAMTPSLMLGTGVSNSPALTMTDIVRMGEEDAQRILAAAGEGVRPTTEAKSPSVHGTFAPSTPQGKASALMSPHTDAAASAGAKHLLATGKHPYMKGTPEHHALVHYSKGTHGDHDAIAKMHKAGHTLAAEKVWGHASHVGKPLIAHAAKAFGKAFEELSIDELNAAIQTLGEDGVSKPKGEKIGKALKGLGGKLRSPAEVAPGEFDSANGGSAPLAQFDITVKEGVSTGAAILRESIVSASTLREEFPDKGPAKGDDASDKPEKPGKLDFLKKFGKGKKDDDAKDGDGDDAKPKSDGKLSFLKNIAKGKGKDKGEAAPKGKPSFLKNFAK